ncbi:15108_t:CDS:2 [Rhizophagus irregularis]|nr:15108_t:CDS:2 [Rhizophagus irregularis]
MLDLGSSTQLIKFINDEINGRKQITSWEVQDVYNQIGQEDVELWRAPLWSLTDMLKFFSNFVSKSFFISSNGKSIGTSYTKLEPAPTKTIEERDYTSSRTVKKRDEEPICPTYTPPGEPSCGIGH